MGANYDIIVAAAGNDDSHLAHISSFLSIREFTVESVCTLEAADIPDSAAILIGPVRNDRVQLVANPSALDIGLQEWFNDNPLAKYLSLQRSPVVHLWSLDSGYAAGYSAYRCGGKVEAECLFHEKAKEKEQIIDGVATPSIMVGHVLGDMLNVSEFVFSSLKEFVNLEIGLANIGSQLGFDAQLVDFYDAIDDKIGVTVKGGSYNGVTLLDWRALTFS